MIDPTVLIYAGYIDGTDAGTGIAVDGAGNAYLTGVTNSSETSFPLTRRSRNQTGLYYDA
jgi:hypothetical protein